MKRFFMFIVFVIAIVSLGLTVYYFSIDNEVIYLKSSYLVLNVGQTKSKDELIDFKNQSKYTTVSFQTNDESSSGGEVLEYNNDGYFMATSGGKSQIIVTTNNRSYSRLVVDVLVCDGTAEYPYIIYTEDELRGFANNGAVPPAGEPSQDQTQDPAQDPTQTQASLVKASTIQQGSKYASYKLGDNIVLKNKWTPREEFYGTFDGNFYTISNMIVEDDGSINKSNAGFIETLYGTVKNLFLKNINIDASATNLGAIAGTNYGTIQTSEVTGTINSKIPNVERQIYVGGIAGLNSVKTQRAIIERSGFEGTIKINGNKQMAGGVAGKNQGSVITETYFRGLVENGIGNEETGAKFGGVVGTNAYNSNPSTEIYDSYFYLTSKTAKTNFINIGGIIYENNNGGKLNVVTGCYYGGEFAETDVDRAFAQENNGNYNASKKFSNGYLTKGEFVTRSKFITVYYDTDNTNKIPERTWNFESVWSFPGASKYPILNVYSTTGSSYIIDFTKVSAKNRIRNQQDLYNALNNNNGSGTGETTGDTGAIANSYEISNDLDMTGFIWGDSTHPIPKQFDGVLTNGQTDNGVGGYRPYKIKNLTIYADSDYPADTAEADKNGNAGLVRVLGKDAIVTGLEFENVTIIYKNSTKIKCNYVGVIAGESQGANITDIKISNVTVNVYGKAYGTLFGHAINVEGNGIKDVSVKSVDMSNAYFEYAGGLVGINETTITATKNLDKDVNKKIYNTASDVNLVAKNVGGAVGANSGRVSYTKASNITFNKLLNETTIKTVYDGTKNLFIGGIAGANSYNSKKGTIIDVQSSILVNAETGAKYKMYVGGAVGYNNSTVSRAYVNAILTITGSHNVFAGGVTGYNAGRITNCFVDENSKISTSIVSTLGATEGENQYILNTNGCSIVGGIAGYDAKTTNTATSINESVSYMKEIKGYYAGGISGISFGKVEYSYCGNSSLPNGGVDITGYMVGGISSVVAGGYVKNSYTFAKLHSAQYGGKYSNVLSVVKMEVSAMGGITVLVLNSGTLVESCYAVVSFEGNGVSYGSSADLTNYVSGKVTNCAYQNAGSIATPNGTKLTEAQLKGTNGYQDFKKALNTNFETWSIPEGNGYPLLKQTEIKLPSLV